MTTTSFSVGEIVPSTRDFLQAVRTRRVGLALVPVVGKEDAAREALRMAEEGVTALAMAQADAALSAATGATRVPALCLNPVRAKEDYLAARAFGADAVLIDASLPDLERAELAKGARSTRMVALEVACDAGAAGRAAAGGAKAVVIAAADAAAVRAIVQGLPSGLLLIAWPQRVSEPDVRTLVGVVDAVIVGVDVYGVTGFERLVSELNP
jgi:indole-3-glycerol phosphate synthase